MVQGAGVVQYHNYVQTTGIWLLWEEEKFVFGAGSDIYPVSFQMSVRDFLRGKLAGT